MTNTEIFVLIFLWLLGNESGKVVKKWEGDKFKEKLTSNMTFPFPTLIQLTHLSNLQPIANYVRSFDLAKQIHPNTKFIKKYMFFLDFLFFNLSFLKVRFFGVFFGQNLQKKKKETTTKCIFLPVKIFLFFFFK